MGEVPLLLVYKRRSIDEADACDFTVNQEDLLKFAKNRDKFAKNSKRSLVSQPFFLSLYREQESDDKTEFKGTFKPKSSASKHKSSVSQPKKSCFLTSIRFSKADNREKGEDSQSGRSIEGSNREEDSKLALHGLPNVEQRRSGKLFWLHSNKTAARRNKKLRKV